MTSVEKRRSGRKKGGHRKRSNGGYSDTSSGGSFLDETDREVSNLTNRAFRSLCIGDEAVYNDLDPCLSSPCSQRDRQQAFSQSGPDRDGEDREREEHKRAGCLSLRVQQYGPEWIHGGIYGANIQRDPQWENYGEGTQGRVSATFHHSNVEASQQQESLREEQLSFLSNGATELSVQHRRSRSRVSSLIRAFNSEGHKDGTGADGKPREWNEGTSWDKSALMSIQRELSEFSTSYQQNYNSGHFRSAGLFSPPDANSYSTEGAPMSHMNSEPSFIGSSHSKLSMSAQVNCNSNFFIHSEFSPFKVWRDHTRFPFQRGEVSGFMHCSEFPTWYETPMYKGISQPQGLYGFQEKNIRHPSNNLASVVSPTPSHSTSTSTVLQKALAVEKRCGSELAGQYPHRKQTQSLGTNRLPTQRPSTASPTFEMSQHVQDTISSVKALQQKIKMMTNQNQRGAIYGNENVTPFGNNVKTVTPNVSSNTSTTPFSISQLLTPLVHAPQEVEASAVQQYAASPQPKEHPPVRAESRGATPDVRMSSYKSRATSLLFNLKDNRKRVKSTYSPPKFKGLETLEKNKQEPRDIVIDIPDFENPEAKFPQVEESSSTNTVSNQYATQHHGPELSFTTLNSQPATFNRGQCSEYAYQPDEMQREVVHSGFTSFNVENYTSNQLANGQNLHPGSSLFHPYKQGVIDNVGPLGDIDRLQHSYTASDIPRLNADSNWYSKGQANIEQNINETVERESKKGDKYKLLKNDNSKMPSQDVLRQTTQDTENLSLKTLTSPRKDMGFLMEKGHHPHESVAMTKKEVNLPRDKHRRENQQNTHKEHLEIEPNDSFGAGKSYKNTGLVNFNSSNQLGQHAPFSNNMRENPAHYGQQQHKAFKEKYSVPSYCGQNKENEKEDNLTQTHDRCTNYGFSNPQTYKSNNYETTITQKSGQRKLNAMGYGMQNLQPIGVKPEIGHNMHKDSLSKPDNVYVHTVTNPVEHRQIIEVKAEQVVAKYIKPQHTQLKLAAETSVQGEASQMELAELILAGQTDSEKVQAEEVKAELTEHDTVMQHKVELAKNGERKETQTEQPTEKQADQPQDEEHKPVQTRVQTVTEEQKNNIEEIGAVHKREAHADHFKTEEAEADKLKVEHIKIELVKTEQTGLSKINTTKHEETGRVGLKLEQKQAGGEQIRTDIKAEQAEEEKSKVEIIKLMQQTEGDQNKMEDAEDDLIQGGQINEVYLLANTSKAKGKEVEVRKNEQVKLEQTQVEHINKELTKTENLEERSTKPAAKPRGSQHVKSETDKVVQVQTELAKAKAELAKTKDKMIWEQTDKVRNDLLTNEDGIKKDALLRLNISKNEAYNNQDQAAQMNLQSEGSALVRRQDTYQVNRGVDDYERLREKYGFKDTTSINRNKLSAVGIASSNENSETPVLTLFDVEKTKDKKSKDKRHSPTKSASTANTENEEVDRFKPSEMTESHHMSSEASEVFKLSYTDNLLDNVYRIHANAASDRVKDDRVEKLEKCEPLRFANVSQQRDSGSHKSLPLERKPKLAELGLVQGNELNVTPSKALSHKERSQTKQEILTSRIKAHAEKEISAIKERGFAIRDGFISKPPAKQLEGSQIINTIQRPLSQEVPKNQASTMPSKAIQKQHMEPPGVQTEPVMSVSSTLSATIPVKSATNVGDFVDNYKQVPKAPMKSNGNVPESPIEAKRADESLIENQRKENQFEMKSLMQGKEQAPKEEGKLAENNGQISGKPKERLQDNIVVNTDHLKKEEEDPSQSTSLVKANKSNLMMMEKNETTQDSAPSLNIGSHVADDELQIMGIMVTVHERNPSVCTVQMDGNTQKQMNAKEKEPIDSELNTHHYRSGIEVKEVSEGNKQVVDNAHPTKKEAQTGDHIKSHPQNVQETSTLDTGQSKMSETVPLEQNTVQQESSCNENVANARPQRQSENQEPLTKNSKPSTVFVPAHVSADTQPCLYKHGMTAQDDDDTNEFTKQSERNDDVKNNTEEKNTQIRHSAHCSDNSIAKIQSKGVNTSIDSNRDSNCFTETLIRHDDQQSVKEDTTIGLNPSKTTCIEDSKVLLQEDKRHDTNSLSYNFMGNVAPKHQYEETPLGKTNQMDSNVHIGSIAISVVPAETEDNLKMVGNQLVTFVPSDVVAANERRPLASLSHEEKEKTLNNEDNTKDLSPGCNEQYVKESVENKLVVQSVVSAVENLPDSVKISNQQNGTNTDHNTQAEKRKHDSTDTSRESVSESKTQPMEGDYFQVQRVDETSNKSHNFTNVGEMSDVALKARELPGVVPQRKAISSELYNEGKNEFAIDQRKMETEESSTASDDDLNRKIRKTGEKLASKQSYGPTEKQSHKIEKREAGQVMYNSKDHTENQSRWSAKERQSTRKPSPTREKYEAKPKPKERFSTIPEISAIADYARLKVIVSEDQEDTFQEFPPNKKEGFFPLIQTRHSRRPVFNADPQDLTVKEKSLPNKVRISSKVSKEPKPLIFPITEKEHQRTGMFKLGDRQEKMLLDTKSNSGVLDNGMKHAQDLRERNKLSANHLKDQRSEDTVAGTDTQKLRPTDQIHLSNNPPLQTSSSFTDTNMPQHLNSFDHLNPCGNPEANNSNPEKILDLHENFASQPTKTVNEYEKNTNPLRKTGEERPEKRRQERFTTEHEETTNRRTANHLEKEIVSGMEVEERAEELRIKHMIEESRASLAREETRANQREEETRARERKAIAIEINKKREKQREAGRRPEEEEKSNQNLNTAEKEKIIQAVREVRGVNAIEDKRRIINQEDRRVKLREEEEQKKDNADRKSVKHWEEKWKAHEEQQRNIAHVEQQRRTALIEEQKVKAAQEEQQRRAAQEEQQKRDGLIEEQQRRASQEEQQRRAAQEEQQRRDGLIEEQIIAKQIEDKILADIAHEKKGEREAVAGVEREDMIYHLEQNNGNHQIEEQRSKRQNTEECIRMQREEEEKDAVQNAKTNMKSREENQLKEEGTRSPNESQTALTDRLKREAKLQMLGLTDDEISAQKREEEDKLGAYRGRTTQKEEQKNAAQRMDALQYYAITSTESERKPREKQPSSPLLFQQRNHPTGRESPDDCHTRPYRPHAPASPALSLPRSTTSSPALGTKPSMFRVKDNTFRGSSFTKSVKPRFHKNFAEDFRVGSPIGSERGEEEQEIVRRSAMTPSHPDTGLNRLAAIKESVALQTTPSSQSYSTPLPHYRPYTRRSIALDEDDSRSVISNMSEDVESFATSATDLADLRGLYDYERPESACSFSSDVSRSLGKPPVVPPKSDKALRRAKRLTTRRIKKEFSKAVADSPSVQEVSSNPSSSSTEVRSLSRHAVASPHFSSPVSLAHAPRMESSLSSSHTENPSSHSSFHASSHAAGLCSLPAASPHAAAPVSLPVDLPYATGLSCHPGAPKTTADVPSSPTLHYANHPAPVTQYHVESTYPQYYPLTQRKVLQDLGSGQYFVVDVPVQVKMKTFFDPETGKYVQLNVRESTKSTSRPQPPVPVNPQQQPLSQDSASGKPLAPIQGYRGYPQSYQPVTTNSAPHQRSAGPVTLHQIQQPVTDSNIHKFSVAENGQSSKAYHCSPEKTPYMDTVNDTDDTYNTLNNTDGPYQTVPGHDTNSHLTGSTVCENINRVHSQYQPRDIITISELEDFMELSDW